MCLIMSAQHLQNRSTIFTKLGMVVYYHVATKLGMVVYYHGAMCRAQKLVHSLKC